MRFLTLAATLVLSACSLSTEPPGGGDETVALVSGTELTISSGAKTCSRDADCTLVWTGCDGCCQQQAINKGHRDWFAEAFPKACAGYSGGFCDCIPARVEPRCVQRTCEAVPSGR